jgi:hypothetical protein
VSISVVRSAFRVGGLVNLALALDIGFAAILAVKRLADWTPFSGFGINSCDISF